MSNLILATSSGSELLALEFQGMPTEQLKAELARQMGVTAQSLVRLAWIVRTLEDRGEDLSDLRISLLSYLRRIAHGQVLPEVVVRYAESPLLISKIAGLPIPDQRPFAEGTPVRLAVRTPDGEGWTHRLVDPLRLGQRQIAQVFDGKGRLRGEGEQQLWLEERDRKALPGPTKPGKKRRVRGDTSTGEVIVGRSRVSAAEVMLALADLKPTPGTGEPTEVVAVRLTPEEHRNLKTRAAQGDTTMVELVRRALRLAGLLGS